MARGHQRQVPSASSAGVDPDDTYNETPYEKGFCFVSYLAHLVGDQAQFDNFLKVWAAQRWAGRRSDQSGS